MQATEGQRTQTPESSPEATAAGAVTLAGHALAWNAPTVGYILCRLTDGMVLDVNETFVAWCGLPRDAIVSRPLAQLPLWKSSRDRRTMIRTLVRAGTFENVRVGYRAGSGETRVARVSAQLRDLDGETCVLAACDDVTELEAAEEAVRQLRRLTAALREVTQVLNRDMELEPLLDHILVQLGRLIDFQSASIMLLEGESLRRVASLSGFETEFRLEVIPRQRFPHIAEVLDRRAPSIIDDTRGDARWQQPELTPTIRSWMGVPLLVQDAVIGLLNVSHARPEAFGHGLEPLIQLFANEAATAIQNTRLYQQARREIEERQAAEAALEREREQLAARVDERTAALQRQTDRQAALASIEPIVHRPSELQEVLDHIVRVATEALPAPGGVNIILAGDEPDQLIISASTVDVTAPKRPVPRIRPRGGVTRHIIQHQELVHISSLAEDRFGSRPQLEAFGLEAYIGVPLVAHGDVLGALFVFSRTPHQWSQEEIEFVQALASRAALTISSVRLYDSLAKANEALTQASKAKDEFLASMSHELRTPLNAILGMSEALQEGLYGPITDEQTHCIQIVRDSGRHLLALIEDILDLATIESGGLPLMLSPVHLPEVCRASIELVETAARKKGQQVSVDLDPLVRVIEADERRVKQVLVNLLTNAIKFTPNNGVVGLTTEGDPLAGEVRLIVWDTGIGIAPEDMKRLFQPFVQLDSSLARRFDGVGLGLALSARMVSMHGGKIELQSTPGQGSRFVVTLPWRLPAAAEDPPHAL